MAGHPTLSHFPTGPHRVKTTNPLVRKSLIGFNARQAARCKSDPQLRLTVDTRVDWKVPSDRKYCNCSYLRNLNASHTEDVVTD